MKPLTSVNPWASTLALRVARQTGWRASEIYDVAVKRLGEGFTRDEIERVIGTIMELYQPGVSFKDAATRLAVLVEEEMEDAEGD